MPRAATAPSARKTAARGTPASSTRPVILVATRKGAWLFHGDARRKAWTADGPHFLGHNISLVMLDPRDGRTLLAAAKTGHLGPTVFPPPTSTATGRKPSGRRPLPTPPAARPRDQSTTPSGSPRAMPASATHGTPAPRRKACSARRTAA